ncbi:MAG: nucleoside:proton symporter [Betaproteobacteria bacterium]|jgi:CNT family concentrative nucleoside transporter|nr:nucleoside:proton symporter [Betaproteobacteria bacterium]
MGEVAHALAGIAGLVALAWLASEARGRIAWRLVGSALALQLVLALLLLKAPGVKDAFLALNKLLLALQSATRAGTAFVFGYVGGGALPFAETHAGASFILAFQALPIVLVMSALSALLFYWRVLPAVVRAISWLLERTLGVGGVLGLSAAANIFVGMVEAPLLVRPWLARITRGELFALMAVGMATIAGTVLFLYASILGPRVPDAIAHLLIASILSAPAAIAVSALMVPSEGAPTGGRIELKSEATSSVDAVTRGTLDGAQLLINIIAMLVVFVALVTLANLMLGGLPAVGGAPLTLERMLGWLLAPLAWLCGIPWAEAQAAGALLGVKTVLNELIAYVQLAKSDALSERSRLLLTYALCGFANFGSLGIMIGGLTTMCPERRAEIVALGMRSIVAGLLATCLTAASVGLIV